MHPVARALQETAVGRAVEGSGRVKAVPQRPQEETLVETDSAESVVAGSARAVVG